MAYRIYYFQTTIISETSTKIGDVTSFQNKHSPWRICGPCGVVYTTYSILWTENDDVTRLQIPPSPNRLFVPLTDVNSAFKSIAHRKRQILYRLMEAWKTDEEATSPPSSARINLKVPPNLCPFTGVLAFDLNCHGLVQMAHTYSLPFPKGLH